MTEERACAHCGEGFPVNRSAREVHRYCAKRACQRERRRLAQRARRQKKRTERVARAKARPSKTWRRERAAYMKSYREEHPGYRARERFRRSRGRPDAVGLTSAVTEAGQSSQELARVYVVTGSTPEILVRVVTATGRTLTVRAETATEAGSRALSVERRSPVAGRAVTEAG
jgi:hypothetical protein